MTIVRNTFEKGVHEGYEPAFQPQGSLRDSLNGRIISITEGNYAWECVSGNYVYFTLTTGYVPIGAIEGNNILYLFTAHEDDDGEGQIIAISNTGTTRILLQEDLGFSLSGSITGFYLEETTSIKRIYWTDGINPPRSMNVADTTNYIYQPQNYTWYYVIGNYVTDTGTGTNYGLYEAFYTEDRASDFVSGGIGTNIILYRIPDNLNFDPNVSFGNILCRGRITGTLPFSGYYFAFRMITNDGYYTAWSPPSYMFSIFKPVDQQTGTSREVLVTNWQRHIIEDIETQSEYGLQIQISGLDTKFKYVELLAFRGLSLDTIDTGRIVAKTQIISETVTINVDQYSGREISFDEYAATTVTISKCSDMIDIRGYNTLVDITEEGQIGTEQQLGGCTIETAVQPVPLDVQNLPYADDDRAMMGLYAQGPDGVVNGTIMPFCWYKVEGSDVYGYPNYDGSSLSSTPATRPYILGLYPYPGWTGGAGNTVTPVMRISKYHDYRSGENVYETHDVPDVIGTKGVMQNIMAGYWERETYRFGILPISKTGKPMYVRWIGDHSFEKRNGNFLPCLQPNGTVGGVIHNNITSLYDYTSINPEGYETYLYANVLYPLISVDLTDIIDQISGFCIVRAPRDKQLIGEGVVEFAVFDNASEGTIRHIRRPSHPQIYQATNAGGLNGAIVPNWDFLWYTNPEHVVNDETPSWGINDKLQVVRVNTVKHGGPSSRSLEISSSHNAAAKYYNNGILSPIYEPGVVSYLPMAPGEQSEIISRTSANRTVINKAEYNSSADPRRWDIGSKGMIIALDQDWPYGTYNYGPETEFAHEKFYIAQQFRAKTTLYNGQSDYGLANTEYVFTGHYQQVTDDFKAAIAIGGKYIAKDIQVFGGDCYINVFNWLRIQQDQKNLVTSSGVTGYNNYSYTALIPIQSTLNTDTRIGKNVALNWPKSTSSLRHYNNGVSWSRLDGIDGPDPELIPSQVVNTAYSNPESLKKNIGVPVGFLNETVYRNRVRYSPKKVPGESQDSFRTYRALDYLDIVGLGNRLVRIAKKTGRLFFWQDTAFGYIPVEERALQSLELGQPVQLGMGSTLDKYDEASDYYGLQHRTGLSLTPSGFVWIDFSKRKFMYFNPGGSLQDLTEKLGLNIFVNNLSYIYGTADAVHNGLGIATGYDPVTEITYFTFRSTREGNYCIGIDTTRMLYHGKYSYYPEFYAVLGNALMRYWSYEGLNIYADDKSRTQLFGEDVEYYVDMIIRGELDISKKFYKCIARGVNNFFTNVQYSALYNINTGSFDKIISEAVNDTHYLYRNGEWWFGIPEDTDGSRIEDLMLRIKLSGSTEEGKVRLYELLTYYTKMF